jgi:acetyl-CoA C-acetyltransferase
MSEHNVVIVSAKRTPIGAFQGVLSPVTAPQLGTAAARAATRHLPGKPRSAPAFRPACPPPR